MNYKIPGLLSVILMFIAFGIADYQLFVSSHIMGVVYIVCFPVVFLNLLYFYCRKCPHVMDKSCRHVIFGLIVESLYGPAEIAPYKLSEILIALIPLAIFILFPQYWLIQNLYLLIPFWILMLIAGLIVRIGVCPKCRNSNCSFCPCETNKRV